MLIFIYLIFNKLVNFYLLVRCWTLKYRALNQICKSYLDREYVGQSCERFCVERSIQLTDCPNILFHTGKDYVFNLRDGRNGDEYILKSRTLHLSVKDFTKDLLIHSIVQILNETFKGEFDLGEIRSLLHLNRPISLNNLDSLDFVTLANLFNLLQDNEYTLSMVLNNVDRFRAYKTLPSISASLSTCGNWYIVNKVHSIIDYSYLDQSKHSTNEKLFIAGKLMDFLVNFQRMNINLELCDTKYEHFGFERPTNDSNLVLIDSDMIYHRLNVQENIKAIQQCQSDDDCDFVACKGVCSQLNNGTKVCSLDQQDNNLKRICHNLFFIEPFNISQLYDESSLGLFVNLDKRIESKIRFVYDLCFKDDLISAKTNRVYLIDERIQSIKSLISRMLVQMM